MKRKATISVFLFFSLQNIYTQEFKDSSTLLNQVIITASRTKSNVSRLPFAVSIISRTDMEKQLSRTVPESLFGSPGLFIQKTNHAGGSPFLRGLTGNQTLILIDGIRLNNSIFRYGPNQYMTLIEPSIIEKIEVLKGSGAVQYGSDAMTGVINLQTTSLSFKSKPEWKEKLLIRNTESGMEMTVRPELKYEGKKFSFVMGASSKKFGDLKGGDTTRFQRPSGYAELSADVKLKLDLGKNWELIVAGQWLQQNNVPVYHKYKLENYKKNTSDPISRGLQYARFNKAYKKNMLRNISAFVAEQKISETRYLSKNGSLITRKENDQISTISAGLDLELFLNRYWSSNSGIEIYTDKLTSSREDNNNSTGTITSLRGLYPNNAKYLNAAIYSMQHVQYRNWSAEAGLRFNMYSASIFDSTLGNVRLNPKAMVFQFGINRQLVKNLFAYINLSDGFRAPNLDDLGTLGIVDFRYEIPAYDLKPERSFNKEFGLKYKSSFWEANLSVFKTNLQGLITRIATKSLINGYQVYKKENIDKGFIRGWEFEGTIAPVNNLRLNISITNLYGQSITKNQPLRRIPPMYLRIGIDKSFKKIKTGLIYDHANPQRRLEAGDIADNRIPSGGTPGFNIVQLYGGYETHHVNFRLYWSNIFNADYRMHGSGINGMGRALSAMLLIQLHQKRA